jgi:hypothetical protein
MTRFWLGRSVAWRLHGHATTTEAGIDISHRSEQTFVAAGRVLAGNPAEFSKKKNAVRIYPVGLEFTEEDFPLPIHRRTKSQE